MPCFVEGCFQPATYSAFYDGWTCYGHQDAVIEHGGLAGCIPHPEIETLCLCDDCAEASGGVGMCEFCGEVTATECRCTVGIS